MNMMENLIVQWSDCNINSQNKLVVGIFTARVVLWENPWDVSVAEFWGKNTNKKLDRLPAKIVLSMEPV